MRQKIGIQTHKHRDHSFNTYAKLSEKIAFFISDMHTYVCLSVGKKIQFSENFVYSLTK